MRVDILVQALQSEGVVDSVIEAAIVKAKMYGMEDQIRRSVAIALGRVADSGYNVFEKAEQPVRVRKVSY
jgi:hypothetical protein